MKELQYIPNHRVVAEQVRIECRVEAFAAIRRAAAVARAAEDYCEGHYDPELDRMFSWVYNHDRDPIAIARGIRMAIRAAIGSEKE